MAILTVGGIVLCGGESRRMGRSKAWLPFGPEVLLQRVVRILSSVVEPVVVVAAPGQELPALPGSIEVVRDRTRGRGPLEGLAAGLERLRERGTDAAYASSTDVPFLEPQFVRRMIDLLGDSMIAVPRVDERHHPLAAVYRVAVLAEIDRLLAASRLRPLFLFERVDTRVVEADELHPADPKLHTLRNVNTPEEYDEAVRVAPMAEPALLVPRPTVE
jgi:molybdopterin-guanine dinucleotide biosynthesis protein A